MNATNILVYHGLVSGLVMDIGESHTSVTPIAESYVLKHAEKRNFNGGNTLEDLLIDNLWRENVCRLDTTHEKFHVAR